MGHEPRLEHGLVKLLDLRQGIAVRLAHGMRRRVIEQNHRLRVQRLQGLTKHFRRQQLACICHRVTRLALARNGSEAANVLGWPAKTRQRRAKRRSIVACKKISARQLFLVELAFHQNNRGCCVTCHAYAALHQPVKLLLEGINQCIC